MDRPVQISVVIPAYNAEKLIGNTIQSVIDQSCTNWEMIVVDDCSVDATRDVVNQYADQNSRIRLITLENNNGGPAAPRNVGIRAASGNWIALLDSDDIWHPQKLEHQLHMVEKLGASFCCTQMRDFNEQSKIIFEEPTKFEYTEISFSQQKIKGRTPTSSIMAKRSLLLEFAFNEDIRYKAVEDYHCWLRILEKTGTCVKMKFPFVYYRRVPGQISGSKIDMLKRVFMVHKEYPGGTLIEATLLTMTHLFGGIYFRILRKEL